jgi:hypothetical protein
MDEKLKEHIGILCESMQLPISQMPVITLEMTFFGSVFGNKMSLCSPGWPGTLDPHASASHWD